MPFTLPQARGLEQEFLARYEEERLRVSKPQMRRATNRMYTSTRREIHLDGELFGILVTNLFIHGSTRRTSQVFYDGKDLDDDGISGHKRVQLLATYRPNSDCRIEELSRPNNTPENPLYRYDKHHRFKLADHEIDAEDRAS